MAAAQQSAPPSDAATDAQAPPPALTTAPPDIRTAAPPATAAPASDGAPAVSDVLARRPEGGPTPSTAPTWTFSLAGGSGITDERGLGGPLPVGFAPAFQGEAQHRQASGWLLGGAIDYGPAPVHRLGYALTAALQQRWSAFRLEESLGFGLEAGVPGLPTTTVTNSSVTGSSSQTTVSTTTAAYLRGFVTAAHPLWREWDVVLRVGVHSDIEATLSTAYLATSVGVRLSLP
jgi:hypothetical protein